jgi:hypothetical protein
MEFRPVRYQEIQPTLLFKGAAGYVVHVDSTLRLNPVYERNT